MGSRRRVAALVVGLWVALLGAVIAVNAAFPLLRLVRWISNRRVGRALLLAGWAWVGWHLLVR